MLSTMLSSPSQRALWNLYWLSEPKLDDVLNGAPSSVLDPELLRVCDIALEQTVGGLFVRELVTDADPTAFARALENSPYTHLAPYELRGWTWAEIVKLRSRKLRGARVTQGNVTYVNFGSLRAPK
jgi:hypothetical protein